MSATNTIESPPATAICSEPAVPNAFADGITEAMRSPSLAQTTDSANPGSTCVASTGKTTRVFVVQPRLSSSLPVVRVVHGGTRG